MAVARTMVAAGKSCNKGIGKEGSVVCFFPGLAVPYVIQ